MTNQELRLLLQHLEDHHPGERAHGERVSVYAVATAATLGFSEEDLLDLRCAAALHDIGKLDLPGELLNKTGQLDGADVIALRRHAVLCKDHIASETQRDWIVAHHERWDGSGYPSGLSAEAIPLGARIISVAETFDVLLNDNRWRGPLTEDAALDEIRRCAGTQFDPAAVQAFLSVQPLIQPVVVPNA